MTRWATLHHRLCVLAIDVDEVTAELEDLYLTDGEIEWLVLPVCHLTLGVSRLGQLVFEADKLDQRPRRERREAA